MNNSAIEAALQSASFHVLLMIVSKTLTLAGFGDVQMLDRRVVSQKSRLGGCELLCETYIGGLRFRTAVKVINDGGRARMLDELVGVVDRLNADLGILVTPHRLSANAAGNRKKYRSARIEVWDGQKLAELLTQYKLGVRTSGGVDYAFFGGMEDYSQQVLEFIANVRP